ncbi:Putative beta-barrel assembly-enhancing protease OS=Stutzerimonas stutzeri OX=316 GN=CXK95_11830 PE=3 SV=1 [Stutzerimonas stutzeri]
MPQMFARLMRQYRYDQKPPEFLLTHPVTDSRIADTTNRAEQLADGGIEDSLRYQLIRARTQLRFETTPCSAPNAFARNSTRTPTRRRALWPALAQIKAGNWMKRAAPCAVAEQGTGRIDLQPRPDRTGDHRQPSASGGQYPQRMFRQYPGSYPLRQARIDR